MSWPLAVLTAVGGSLGCVDRDPTGRVAVTGEVAVDGAPLASGAISLEPIRPGPTTAGARIRAGAFAIERSKGPIPGSYRVRIYASSREQAPKPPGGSDRTRRPMMERIPPEYNARSTQVVEIRRDGSNHLRFDVETAGASR